MTKLTTWALLCAFGFVCLFSSCQSSKVAYGNKRYFKQTPRPVAQPLPQTAEKAKTAQAVTPQELYASTQEAVAKRDAKTLVEHAREKLTAAMEKSNNVALKEKAQRMNELANAVKSKELTRKEARAKRKELKQELRSLVKEYKTMSPDATQDLDQNLKISLILVAVALLLSVIAAATSTTGASAIFAILGVLAWVGALVFFIIWLVEEA